MTPNARVWLRPQAALNYYLRNSCHGAQNLAKGCLPSIRHSRNPLAGIHSARLDARQKTAGMTGWNCLDAC